MSDIGPVFGSLDLFVLALVASTPGFVIGAGLGALAWKRRRIIGAIIGAIVGAPLSLGAVILKLVYD
jgi:putative Mn2+ efflux pump MntP